MADIPKGGCSRFLFVIVTSVVLCASNHLPACFAADATQIRIVPLTQADANAPGSTEDYGLPWLFPLERQIVRQMAAARELLREERYAEGVRLLGSLLESDEDYFLPADEGNRSFRSARLEANRILSDIPADGMKSYSLLYGARADQLLQDALTRGDLDGIRGISGKYFHTVAGRQATFLIGMNYFQQGQWRLAAFLFNRLSRSAPLTQGEVDSPESLAAVYHAACLLLAGEEDRARDVLADLKQRRGGELLWVRGKRIPWFQDESDAAGWLHAELGISMDGRATMTEDWPQFGGDASRNGKSTGGKPLLYPLWKVRNVDHPGLEDIIERLRETFADGPEPALPVAHPIAVGNMAFLRTPQRILAVDLETGKRMWEAASARNDELVEILEQAKSRAPNTMIDYNDHLRDQLEQRVWNDAIFGQISSDGTRLYYVDELDLAGSMDLYRRGILQPNGRWQLDPLQPVQNKLAALDIAAEGKILWRIGGDDGEDDPSLAQAFFLGPPIPLWNRLFVLVEQQGEIRLLELDPATGKRLWGQALAVVEYSIQDDISRRLAGGMPSFADGVMVCPTSAGAVVAVDPISRSLLWGYQYPMVEDARASRIARMQQRARFRASQSPQPTAEWENAVPLIADGRVFITPMESDELHCIDLTDGELLWKKPRGNSLYLACVYQDRAVLVEHDRVVELSVHDGSPIWDQPFRLPDGVLPSGRGYRDGEFYYLPLTNSSVARINLASGGEITQFRSWADRPLGNLICHRGRLISLGTQGLVAFHQSEPLSQSVSQTLRDQPDNPKVLSQRGLLHWEAGRLDEAIADFNRAYETYQTQWEVTQNEPPTTGTSSDDGDTTEEKNSPEPPADTGHSDDMATISESNHVDEKAAATDLALRDQAIAGLLETRPLLFESLAELVTNDFSKKQPLLARLDELVANDAEQARIWRIAAQGWLETGHPEKALEVCLLAVEEMEQTLELDQIDSTWRLRRDRWVEAEIMNLRLSSERDKESEHLNQLDENLVSFVNEKTSENSSGIPDYLLRRFARIPGTEEPIERRLRQSSTFKLPVQWEQYWLNLISGAGKARTAKAAEAISSLYESRGRDADAAEVKHWARLEFNPDNGVPQQTDVSLDDEGTADDASRRDLPSSAHVRWEGWPQGAVEGEIIHRTRRQPSRGHLARQQPVYSIPDVALPFAVVPNVMLEFDRQQQQLLMNDPLNRRSQVFPLPERQVQINVTARGPLYAYCRGHLWLVPVADRLIAFNGLREEQSIEPGILWSCEMRSALDENAARMMQQRVRSWAPQSRFIDDHMRRSRRPFQSEVAVTETGAYFQDLRSLICADPISGEVLWRQGNIPAGCTVLGDEKAVMAISGEQSALLFRSLDGKALGNRNLPRAADSITTMGRLIITGQRKGSRWHLAAYDPLIESNIWEKQTSAQAAAALVDHDQMAVLEPNGSFVVFSLATGSESLATQLPEEQEITGLHVVSGPDQYYVVAARNGTSRARAENTTTINYTALQTFDGLNYPPLSDGRIHAVNCLDGTLLWPEVPEFRGYSLVDLQPAASPVLLLARKVQRTQNSGGRGRSSTTTQGLMCIDKRNGRIVFQQDTLRDDQGGFSQSIDNERNIVAIEAPSSTVTLQFTDQPISAQPDEVGIPWDGFSNQVKRLFNLFGEIEGETEPEDLFDESEVGAQDGAPSGDVPPEPIDDD